MEMELELELELVRGAVIVVLVECRGRTGLERG